MEEGEEESKEGEEGKEEETKEILVWRFRWDGFPKGLC